jgi:hypothetical protein
MDLGTGSGEWYLSVQVFVRLFLTYVYRAIDMADEFPRAEVIGVDLAPMQPR